MTGTISKFAREQLDLINVNGVRNLVEAFDEATDKFAAEPAYVSLGATTSFAELRDKSARLATWLLGPGGLEPGDRVAIQLPNLTQYPIAAWAAIRAGLVIVNTNPMYTARELVHQFNDSGAKALIVLADLLPVVEAVLPQTKIETVVVTGVTDLFAPQPLPRTTIANVVPFAETLEAGAEPLPPANRTMDDTVVLQYTSGTTGVAKGAVLTHGNVFAVSRMSDATFGTDPDERNVAIAPMPLYHIYGFAVNIVSGVFNGSVSVLIPDARNTDALVRTMREHPFTVFPGINTLFMSLMRHPDFDLIDFSHLNKTISGGTPLVEEVAIEWEQRTGAQIYEGYGLSESAAGGSVNTPGNRRLGTVGKPLAYSELRVVNDSGAVAAPGESGELQIRGPHVTVGYWNRPEATAEVLDADGWFRTGDVAVIEEDGFVRIVDRLKDMILVSGFNVYPAEIEAVVYGLDDVVECAAIGIPDEQTGEAVKLFVALKDGVVTEDDISQHCRGELAAYKVPKAIEIRDELPKSVVGKILRRELREPQ